MRIAMLARELRKAGTTTHILDLAEYLRSKGHEIYVLSYWREDKVKFLIEDFKKNEIVLVKLPLPNDDDICNTTLLGRLKQVIKLVISFALGEYYLFKIKPDLVHVHFPIVSLMGKMYSKIFKVPLIITFHIGEMKLNILYAKGDKVIAVSSEVKDMLERVFHYNEKNIALIFNGVKKDKYFCNISEKEKFSLKKSKGFKPNDFIILYVGRIEFRKGVDILVKAFSKCKSEYKLNNIKLIIVGDGNKDWLNEMAKEYNVENDITVTGFISPTDYYKIADIFVLPSRVEGFGLVCVEAMMCGLPVIRSKTEGAKDQIIDGVDGFIFEKEDVDELAEKIYLLYRDVELRRRISKNAQQKAVNLFSSEKMGEETLKLYSEALQIYGKLYTNK